LLALDRQLKESEIALPTLSNFHSWGATFNPQKKVDFGEPIGKQPMKLIFRALHFFLPQLCNALVSC